MPTMPKKPCAKHGCPELVAAGERYCEQHKKENAKNKPSSLERGYDRSWSRVRKIKANQDPLCERCIKAGIVKPLVEIHHKIPIQERPDLRLSLDNLESLCRECHLEEHKEDRWRKR